MKTRFIMTGIAAFIIALLAERRYGDLTGNVMAFLLPGETPAMAAEPGTAKAVFVVHCYDEGKDALKDMKGVTKVERGFRNFREINTVYYDPMVVTIEELEQALKKAGTYVETLPSDGGAD